MTGPTRRQYLATVGAAAALAGCFGSDDQGNYDPGGNGGNGGGNGDTGAPGNRGTDAGTGTTESGGPDGTGSAFPFPTAEESLPLPTDASALRGEARSGGPPKDGIPSIDEPSFAGADGADFLDDGDPVFGVARDGAIKAYPQKILVQHEIVNDTLSGDPVAVTYCPLTGTVQGFERGETTFGVSGRLINNNLVMYDRETEAWWPQVLATSIPGPWNEDPPAVSLREFRLVWTTWGRWRDRYPDTRVLTTDTGYARNYGRDPYGTYNPKGGYYDARSTLFPRRNPDDRHHPKAVFMGARTPDGAVAFEKSTLLEEGTMTGELGGTPALAVADPRLSTGYVYLNPEDREFEHDGEAVVGADGTEHRPDELPLGRVHTFDAMWFAWSGFYPESNVYA